MDVTHELRRDQRRDILLWALTSSPRIKDALEGVHGDVRILVEGPGRKEGFTVMGEFILPATSARAVIIAADGKKKPVDEVIRMMGLSQAPIVTMSCAPAPGENPGVAVATYDDGHHIPREQLKQKFYPRIYRGAPKCGAYSAADAPAAFFSSLIHSFGDREPEELRMTVQGQTAALGLALLRFDMQQLWVGEQISRELMATQPPDDLDWTTLALRFDAMTLMVPKGVITGAEGDVEFISFAVSDIGGQRAGITWVARTNNTFLYTGLSAQKNPIVSFDRLAELTESLTDRTDPVLLNDNKVKPTEDSNTIHSNVTHYLFSVLMALDACPTLVKESRFERSRKINGEVVEQYWSHRVFNTEPRERKSGTKQGGTHASPRQHWVWGHWTNQPYGPNSSLRRRTWIRPYERGGDVAAD